MPLIVVGADTSWGEAILERLSPREREVRLFVSDPARGSQLRESGFKVATGDVSDESHVEAASTRCFSAVLIVAAAHDERERSFADTPEAVIRGWANAMASSEVTRVIWVTGDDPPETAVAEVAAVDPSDANFVDRVIAMDDASSLR
jgi:putative NADH-flavin reductase